MAKSGVTFKTCVSEFDRLLTNVRNRKFAQVYLLMGEEGYFIDRLSAEIADTALTEAERSFDQTVVYGKDTKVGDLCDLARQMPMMGALQVVVVKEAQQLDRFEELSHYVAKPSPSTVLVLCYKGKSVDKRLQVYKHIATSGIVFESVRPRDYEMKDWLRGFIEARGLKIEPKAVDMIVDHLGTDISKISNELDKLVVALPVGTVKVTPDDVEQNIGISKDFNIYELCKAVTTRNVDKALTIADYFARNPKNNPPVVTIMALFGQFKEIFLINYYGWLVQKKGVQMPSDAEFCRILRVSSPFIVGELKQAARLYPNKVTFQILGIIRQYDARSKGIGGGGLDDGELLREMLLKIFSI